MGVAAFRIWCVCVVVLSRMFEIRVVNSETIISRSNKNTISNKIDDISTKHFDQPNLNDVNIIVERMTRLESIVLDHQISFEKFQDDVKEEIKVMRNATLLLLSLVSGRGSECQGIKDTTSKIKILYAALASYEPTLNFPRYEDEFYSSPGSDITSTGATSTQEFVHEFGLESGDLVLDSITDGSTANASTQDYTPSMTTTTATAAATRATTSTGAKIRTTRAPTAVCPQGSRLVGRECFSVHLDLQLNWTSARAFCRKLGGDLAEPNLHNDKLPRQLLKTWPAFGESSYWTLWVGATDQEKEGEWHWVTGGLLSLNESSRWDVGEPVDVGEAQDCLAMILWVPGRWQRWDLLDDPCDLEWFFFCEYSP